MGQMSTANPPKEEGQNRSADGGLKDMNAWHVNDTLQGTVVPRQ